MSQKYGRKYKACLEETGTIMIERALEAKKNRDKEEKGSLDYMYNAGQLLAYYDIISTMQMLAGGFLIDLKEIGLHEINPDKDLI